jgi:hypothetical protein
MNHYSQVIAGISSKWWWEALAVQADRVVFPNNKPYEAEQYAGESSQNLAYLLHRSWDDCNEEPLWYTSGGFLSYLMHYRPGRMAEFREIFTRPAGSIAPVRTSLDNYLRNDLGSRGIGWEYHDYLKWCYDNKGFAAIDTGSAGVSGNPHTTLVRLNEQFSNPDTVAVNIPYMAARIFRIRNDEMKKKTIVVKNSNQSDNVVLYAYLCSQGSRQFLMTLRPANTGDSLIQVFADKRQWLDIVTINNSNSDAGNAELIVAEKINAEGDYKGRISFADNNTSMARYTITISDLHIIIDDKNQASGTVEFLMEYPKDGMVAVCTDFKGSVNTVGRFLLSGRVKETAYPKCKTNCCTYELIKQGSPCFKISKSPFWHFEGKVKITALKKEIEGTIVVTPSASPPANGKAAMKYVVSTL